MNASSAVSVSSHSIKPVALLATSQTGTIIYTDMHTTSTHMILEKRISFLWEKVH